jgi:flagellar hook protein FlgE
MAYSLAPGSTGFTGSTAALVPVNISGAKLVATPTSEGTFAANLNSNAAAITGAPSIKNYTNKSSVVAYDNLGNPVTLDLYFSKTGTNGWQVDVYNEASPTAPLATQTLNFNPADGSLNSPTPLSIAVPNGQTVSLNIGDITQLASPFAVTATTMNGTPPSQWQGVSIGKDGTLDNLYSNGQQIPAYQVPLANVVSPDKLTSVTGNGFAVNASSGSLLIGSASVGGLGTINSSELETSTVDLATQLTDMIVAQRGYESNSKVFQTGSEMLSTLINTLHS